MPTSQTTASSKPPSTTWASGDRGHRAKYNSLSRQGHTLTRAQKGAAQPQLSLRKYHLPERSARFLHLSFPAKSGRVRYRHVTCTVWAECLDPHSYQEPGAWALASSCPCQAPPVGTEHPEEGRGSREKVYHRGAQHPGTQDLGKSTGRLRAAFSAQTMAASTTEAPGAEHPKIRVFQGCNTRGKVRRTGQGFWILLSVCSDRLGPGSLPPLCVKQHRFQQCQGHGVHGFRTG